METTAKINEESRVSVTDFGKNHYSLLMYLYVRQIDGQKIKFDNMRCNRDRHPHLAPNYPIRENVTWNEDYGTKLKGYFEDNSRILHWHDDWDCLEDLEAAGFVEIVSLATGIAPLTELGIEVAAKLAKHKIRGGNFAEFSFEIEPTKEV